MSIQYKGQFLARKIYDRLDRAYDEETIVEAGELAESLLSEIQNEKALQFCIDFAVAPHSWWESNGIAPLPPDTFWRDMLQKEYEPVSTLVRNFAKIKKQYVAWRWRVDHHLTEKAAERKRHWSHKPLKEYGFDEVTKQSALRIGGGERAIWDDIQPAPAAPVRLCSELTSPAPAANKQTRKPATKKKWVLYDE